MSWASMFPLSQGFNVILLTTTYCERCATAYTCTKKTAYFVERCATMYTHCAKKKTA